MHNYNIMHCVHVIDCNKLCVGGARWKAECCERRAEILAEASSRSGASATPDRAHSQERETKERAGNIRKCYIW